MKVHVDAEEALEIYGTGKISQMWRWKSGPIQVPRFTWNQIVRTLRPFTKMWWIKVGWSPGTANTPHRLNNLKNNVTPNTGGWLTG